MKHTDESKKKRLIKAQVLLESTINHLHTCMANDDGLVEFNNYLQPLVALQIYIDGRIDTTAPVQMKLFD